MKDPKGNTVFEVLCPHCGALVGFSCVSLTTSRRTDTHVARRELRYPKPF